MHDGDDLIELGLTFGQHGGHAGGFLAAQIPGGVVGGGDRLFQLGGQPGKALGEVNHGPFGLLARVFNLLRPDGHGLFAHLLEPDDGVVEPNSGP